MKYNVCVVGATGNVGRQMLAILAERNFPVNNVYAVASSKSAGKVVSFGDANLIVQNIDKFDFSQVQISLFSAGSHVSKKYAPLAAKHSIVIDNTSCFRMHDDVPLIVTEVNAEMIKDAKTNIIANPNCAVMQMMVALKPLHDHAKVKRIVVTTFQSVAGAGKAAMDELYYQTKAKYEANDLAPSVFPHRIAFNIIPQIGDFEDNNNTSEENKIINETKKILDPAIEVSATCVRVPVFIGHSVSMNVEFCHDMDAALAEELLSEADGVVLLPAANHAYTCPIDAAGDDAVYVSRIRNDESKANTINCWVVSDSLRKGAALNAVQIAEEYINYN